MLEHHQLKRQTGKQISDNFHLGHVLDAVLPRKSQMVSQMKDCGGNEPAYNRPRGSTSLAGTDSVIDANSFIRMTAAGVISTGEAGPENAQNSAS